MGQQLINALSIGSIYALVALGYTMVYGIIKLINFAHGDMLMLGAYFTFWGITSLGLPVYIAIPFSAILSACCGFLIEKIAYKPLRNSPRIVALITSIGVSYLIQNIMILIMGTNTQFFPNDVISSMNETINIANIIITYKQIMIIVVTLIGLYALQYLVKETNMGRAMRACSTDMEAAQLMGINVNKTISTTFMISAFFAGLAGSFIALYYNSVWPLMGVTYGLKAFIAAVFGGIGLIPGAMLGGYAIGLIETLVVMNNFSTIKDAVVYSILIIVLVFKPSGLLGKETKEKV